MRHRLFAMLILASWAPAKGQPRPLPEPPRDREVISVGIMGANRQVRRISVSVPAPPAADDEDDERPRPRPVVGLNINNAVVEPENFDHWLFGEAPSEKARQRHLNDLLRAKIDSMAVRHRLTGAQREKLRIAGRGDIKRFFDQVEERRTLFEKERKSFRTGIAALHRLDAMAQVYKDGPFGDGSLLVKTLRKIDDERKAGRDGAPGDELP